MTEYNKPEGKKRRKSVIIGILSRFADSVRRKAAKGFFGRIFSGYTRENDALKSSVTASFTKPTSKFVVTLKKVRFAIADHFEESRILHAWRIVARFLTACKLRLYGTFLLTFSIYSGLVYLFKRFILVQEPDVSVIVWAAMLLVVSLPLLLTGKTLTEALTSSKTGYFIVSDILGIPDEKLSVKRVKRGDSYNIAILAGIVLGLLTYFVQPMYFIFLFGMLISAALVMSRPEIGVLMTALFIPVLSYGGGLVGLNYIVALFTFSYLIKLLRGKRTIGFEMIDLVALFFCVMVIFAGIATVGREQSVNETINMVLLMIGCFVAGNLMKTAVWQHRCVLASIFAGFVVSMIVIWEYVGRFVGDIFGYNDMLFGFEIPFFGNPEVLSAYLTITIVLICGLSYRVNGVKKRTVACMVALTVTAALIIIGSVPGWISAAIAVFAFYLIMSGKTITAAVFSIVVIPSVVISFGGLISDKLSSLFNYTSGMTAPAFQTWHGSFKLLIASYLCGVGTGGFSQLYPFFAETGHEAVPANVSLWVRVACDMGIVGAILLAAVIFLFLQNGFEYLKNPVNKHSGTMTAAGIATMTGLISVSVYCDIWDNKAMFFMFWALIYVFTASIKTGRYEIEKIDLIAVNDETSSSITLS